MLELAELERHGNGVPVGAGFGAEAINGGDLTVLDETWADDMTWHGGSMGTYEGKPAFIEFVAANAAGAWADMHLGVLALAGSCQTSSSG